MRFIEQIDAAILQELHDKRLRLNGLAEPIIVTGDTDEILPAVVTSDGECLQVFDDSSEVGIYHKITRKAYTYESSKGFGDAKKRKSQYSVQMVVWGNRRSVTDYHALEARLTATISRFAEVADVNFNRLQVFGEEFQGVPFFVQPNIFLFKINYKISSTESRCE